MAGVIGGIDGSAPLATTTITANSELATAIEIDLEGVQVRDAVHLFLSRVIDPSSHFAHLQMPGNSALETHHLRSNTNNNTNNNNNINGNNNNVELHGDSLVEKDMAQLVSAGTLQYIVEQIERIATCSDWVTCVVRWSHFIRCSEDVAIAIESDFQRFAPFCNEALHRILMQYYSEDYLNRGRCKPQLVFSNVPRCLTIRALRASMVGQLCSIRGVVTRSSQVRPELRMGVFRCSDCGTESIPIEQPFHYTEPPCCRNEECENTSRFQLIPHHPQTQFGDWQKLRIQEDANNIPAGCMPRTMEVIVRGDAVEVAKPGDRVIAVGCVIVVPEVMKLFNQLNRREVQRQMTSAQRAQNEAQNDLEGATGLRALGVRELNYRMCFLATTITDSNGDDRKMTHAVKDVLNESNIYNVPEHFRQIDAINNSNSNNSNNRLPISTSLHLTPAEERKVLEMRQHPSLLKALTGCIAPNIFKHEVVKLGLLLQMVGGVSKTTIERIALRGDINICIVGDPSTAKSQFLKWVAANNIRGVYTSGKASTASGLTATVTRDSDTGERTIEAGALMLSDHGICCIDEFDKMEIKDQVAIHEAMEQQTISIAKAGIKATLNAKTSLLAALNPIGGKYDRRKPLQKNIAMSAPIMSRFDLMFVIVDDAGKNADEAIADQLLRLHRFGGSAVLTAFKPAAFQLYVRFARTLMPRLTPEASELIVSAYRDMRLQDSLSNRSKVYRVTTRLLESMIRLSEATAKLFLCEEVNSSHVAVALELMRQSLSTLDMTEVELTGEIHDANTALDNNTSSNNNNNDDDNSSNNNHIAVKRECESGVSNQSNNSNRRESLQEQEEQLSQANRVATTTTTTSRVSTVNNVKNESEQTTTNTSRDGSSKNINKNNNNSTSKRQVGELDRKRQRERGAKQSDLRADAASDIDNVYREESHERADQTCRNHQTERSSETYQSDKSTMSHAHAREPAMEHVPRTVTITANHYFIIVNRLVSRLQMLGEHAAPTRHELEAWYLEQVESVNRSQLEAELRYVNLVLSKMIQEGKLIEVQLNDKDVARIFLDPNYNPDVTQHEART